MLCWVNFRAFIHEFWLSFCFKHSTETHALLTVQYFERFYKCVQCCTFSSAKQESATALKKRVCLLVYRITFGCLLNLSYHSSKWYSQYVLCSSKHLYVSSPTGAQPGAVRIPPQSHPVQVLPRTWRIRSDSEGSLMVTSRDPRRKSE